MKRLNKMMVSILAAFVVAVSLVVPNALADGGGKEIPIHILDYTIKDENDEVIGDGAHIEYQLNKSVKLSFSWKVDDINDENLDLKSGDFSLIDLPDVFKQLDEQSSGQVKGKVDNEEVVIATWSITKDNKLKWVYNDKLELNNKNRSGDFWFWLTFDEEILEENSKQEIKFGDAEKEMNIIVKPSGDTVYNIKKFGKAESDFNAEKINWEIIVNTSLDKLTDGKVKDQIPEGLKLDLNSIVITELQVGLNGIVTDIEGVPTGVTTEGSSESELVVNLGDTTSAYRITFTTDIVGEVKSEGSTNTAELYSSEEEKPKASAEASVNLQLGSLIEKNHNNPGKDAKEIIWTLDVNKAERDLGDVKVEDVIPKGLDLTDLKIYDLEYDKITKEWIAKNESTPDPMKFPIEFKDLKTAKRIVYKTSIDYGTDYEPSTTFKNNAVLKDSDDGLIATDSKEVTVERSSLIEKTGVEITDYDQARIKWTMLVNSAEHSLTDLVVQDKIGEGHILITDTLKIFDKDGNSVESGFKIIKQEDNGFEIKFEGKITSQYKIVYETEIVDFKAEFYNNEFGINGGGVGNGDHTSGNTPAKPTIENTLKKSGQGNLKVDFEKKIMYWQLVLDLKKEGVKAGSYIEDVFIPEGSMALLTDPSSFKVLNKNGDALKPGVDYELDPNIFVTKGFKLTFKEALDQGTYTVKYQTSFDPDFEFDGNKLKLKLEKVYENKAKFTGETYSGKKLELVDDDRYTLKDGFHNAGNKYVEEVKVNEDGERILVWHLNINTMEQNLKGTDFVIVDTLYSETDNVFQIHNKDVKVYKNTIKGNNDGLILNNISWDENQEFTDYDLEYSNDLQAYTLTFKGGIDASYHITYTTKLEGISQENYSNVANVSGKGGYNFTYEASTSYENFDQFTNKEALNLNQYAYIDDIIDWKVTLNNSLSEITDAIFEDKISNGHVFLGGSLNIQGKNKLNGYLEGTSEGDDGYIENPDYTYTLTRTEDDFKILKVTFKTSLKEKLVVTYQTVVVAENNAVITNEASLKGLDTQLGESSKKQYTARVSSGGTGTGERHGSIVINKRNNSVDGTLIKQETEFKLTYKLNGEDRIVGGGTKFTVDGVLKYENLPFREYTLTEVTPPLGFEKDKNPVTIDLKSGELGQNNTYTYNFVNEKTKISFETTKVWKLGSNVTKPTITFALERSIDGNEFERVPNSDKTVVENAASWSSLDKTNDAGDEYIYRVIELKSDGTKVNEGEYLNDNFKVEYAENGRTVTNTYVPTEISVTAQKKWELGANFEKPAIKFQILRTTVENPKPSDFKPFGEAIKDVTTTNNVSEKVTWDKLPETDNEGNLYTYQVVELNEDGTSFNHGNFYSTTNVVDGKIIITNTYKSSKDYVEATKIWVNGDTLERPVIYFKLYRTTDAEAKIGDEGVDYVEGTDHLEVVTPKGETEVTVTWTNLDITDEEGKTYHYLVEEVNKDGEPLELENYVSEQDGLEVTNTYVIPKGEISAKKTWDGGSEKDKHQDITLQLLQDGEPFDEPVLLEAGTYTYTWDDLDLTDITGRKHVYTVVELDVPENYKVSYDGLEITNTYVSPLTSKSVKKIWVDGPVEKTPIEVQLYRNGKPYLEPVTLDGTEKDAWTHTWDKLNLNDDHGVEYVYSVQEVTRVENYVASYDGMNITNTYVIPVTDITVEKIWIHENRETQTIGVQLYRNGEAFGNIVRLEKGTNTYTWKDLALTDLLGNEYVYTVDEVEVPLGYHKEVRGFTIINTFNQGLLDALIPKPDGDKDEKPKDKLPLTGAVSLASIATCTLFASGLFYALSKKRKED